MFLNQCDLISTASGRCPLRVMFSRNCALSVVKMWMPLRPREIVTYHCWSFVAACTAEAVARGVTAPAMLEYAAKAIGGGAGGKDILAMAGGPRADAVGEALGGIAARLGQLLAGA